MRQNPKGLTLIESSSQTKTACFQSAVMRRPNRKLCIKSHNKNRLMSVFLCVASNYLYTHNIIYCTQILNLFLLLFHFWPTCVWLCEWYKTFTQLRSVFVFLTDFTPQLWCHFNNSCMKKFSSFVTFWIWLLAFQQFILLEIFSFFSHWK